MRKLLGFCLVVLLLSGTLAGPVKAATIQVAITLDTRVLIAGLDNYAVTGTVKKPSGSPVTGPIDVWLADPAGNSVCSGVVMNGRFDLQVLGKDLKPNFTYHIDLDDDDLAAAGLSKPGTLVTLVYRYDVILNPLPSFKFGDPEVPVSGKVVDASGNGISGATVEIAGAMDTTRSTGTFAVPTAITRPTKITVRVAPSGAIDSAGKEILLEYGSITPSGAKFNQFSAVSGAVHTAMEAELGLKLVAMGSDVTRSSKTIYTFTGVKIRDNGAKDRAGSVVVDGWFTTLVIAGSDLPGTGRFLFGNSGTLKVQANYSSSLCVGEVGVTIKDPSNLNLTVSGEVSVDGVYQNSSVPITLEVCDQLGGSPSQVGFTIEGPGMEKITDKVSYREPIEVRVAPHMGGKITVNVTGYDRQGTAIGKASSSIQVDGYSAVVSPTDIVVNTRLDLSFTIKDAVGTAVNDAIITFDTTTIDGTKAPGTQGKYVFVGLKLSASGDRPYRVCNSDGGLMAFGVIPAKEITALTIEPTSAKITSGVETDLSFRVKAGSGIYEDLEDLNGPDGEGVFVEGVEYDVRYSPETRVYTIQDITVWGSSPVVDIVFRGGKMGTTKLKAVPPSIKIEPAKLTLGYPNKVKISITDSVSGQPVKADVNWDYTELDADWPELEGESEYQFELTPVPDDADGDNKLEAQLNLELAINGQPIAGTLKVATGPAKLTVEPAQLIAGGTNRVTLKLTGAGGEGLEGCEIDQGDTPLGMTTATGELITNISPAFAGTCTFTAKAAEGASSATVKTTVVEDRTPPVIKVTLPQSVTGDLYHMTGTVTDNNAVAYVYINNFPAAIVPGASTMFMYDLPLIPGENTVAITAIDRAGNGSSFLGKIKATKSVPRTVSVTIGKVEAGKGLDVAAFIASGRTMVPLRFISEALGASVEWDQASSMAQIKLGDKAISVQLESTVARVGANGVTLLVPPAAKSGRTFVGLTDMARLLGGSTSWDDITQTATITLP